MDVVVWTESEVREAWWRAVLGLDAGAHECDIEWFIGREQGGIETR